jgi:predicted outer membrane repeat protein
MIYIERGQNGFVLRSEMGPSATFLDAEYRGRVLFIAGMNFITVEGFTIQRGMAPLFGDYNGGGIATHLSHDIIRNCVFRHNAANSGGGMWCGGVSSPELIDCSFYFNQAINGAAVFLSTSSQSPTFRSCTFRNNTASGSGGALYAAHNGFNLESCVLAHNSAALSGGAIYARDVWPSAIVSCTIAENTASDAAAVGINDCPSVALTRSIIAYNLGASPFSSINASVLTVSCSDIFGNTTDVFSAGVVDAGGCFSVDPVFCGPPGSLVFTIAGNSPCAPGSHPDGVACGLIGALGPNCGSVSVKPVTWGQLKSLYRGR